MTKIGYLRQTTENNKADMIGKLNGNKIYAWIGRDKSFRNYIKIYYIKKSFRLTTKKYVGDYYGRIKGINYVGKSIIKDNIMIGINIFKV